MRPKESMQKKKRRWISWLGVGCFTLIEGSIAGFLTNKNSKGKRFRMAFGMSCQIFELCRSMANHIQAEKYSDAGLSRLSEVRRGAAVFVVHDKVGGARHGACYAGSQC